MIAAVNWNVADSANAAAVRGQSRCACPLLPSTAQEYLEFPRYVACELVAVVYRLSERLEYPCRFLALLAQPFLRNPKSLDLQGRCPLLRVAAIPAPLREPAPPPRRHRLIDHPAVLPRYVLLAAVISRSRRRLAHTGCERISALVRPLQNQHRNLCAGTANTSPPRTDHRLTAAAHRSPH